MPALILAVVTLTGFVPGFFALQADHATITVTNVQAGEVLQGIVQIQGTVQAEQFSRYEVSFSYSSDTTGTWFLIEEGSQQVEDGLIANWDTSRISDGDYRLRVLVTLTDGAIREMIIPDLRVRNYTPFDPTETAPVERAATLGINVGTPKPTSPAFTETPTPGINNPGSLTERNFLLILGCGAGAAVFIFIVFGLYLAISRQPRRR